jgi:hypothetical protein
MQTNGAMSAFEAIGEAHILAAQGRQELANLIAEAVSSRFRSIIARLRGGRTGAQSSYL